MFTILQNSLYQGSLYRGLSVYLFFIIQGWTIPAAAMPKDFLSADLRNKAGITTKPFLVNLTFWEDRPRLNFWEKILLKRKQLAKQAKNEAKEEEISAYMAEVSNKTYQVLMKNYFFAKLQNLKL